MNPPNEHHTSLPILGALLHAPILYKVLGVIREGYDVVLLGTVELNEFENAIYGVTHKQAFAINGRFNGARIIPVNTATFFAVCKSADFHTMGEG